MCVSPQSSLLRWSFSLLFSLGLALAAQAELKPNPAAVDFGRQRQEKVVRATVTLTNTGEAPVEIMRVSADCSCAAATPSQLKLGPGESTQMEVTFDTRTYQGEIQRRVMVQTTEGHVVIPVTAVVSPYEHWLLGAQLAMFRPSEKGEKSETSFTLHYTGQAPIEITALRSSVSWLDAVVTERTGQTFTLKLTKKPGAPAGTHQPTVTVVTTDAKEPDIRFSAFVSVNSRLLANPNPIVLPFGKVGERISMPVSLSGWEPEAAPRGEIDEGEVILEERDRTDALITVAVTPTKVGTSTRLLRLYAGEFLEAEIPVIVRVE